MNLSKVGRVVAASAAAVATLGVAERIIDPFDRHDHNYVLEGPQSHSEVFYVSSNWYDESGNKHDDRMGDLMLLADGIGLIGYVSLAISDRKAVNSSHSPSTAASS